MVINQVKIIVGSYEGVGEKFIKTNIAHMPLLVEVLKEHYSTDKIYIIELVGIKDKSLLSKLTRYFVRYIDENETEYF